MAASSLKPPGVLCLTLAVTGVISSHAHKDRKTKLHFGSFSLPSTVLCDGCLVGLYVDAAQSSIKPLRAQGQQESKALSGVCSHLEAMLCPLLSAVAVQVLSHSLPGHSAGRMAEMVPALVPVGRGFAEQVPGTCPLHLPCF